MNQAKNISSNPIAHGYRVLLNKLYPGLDALIRNGIITPKKLFQFIGDFNPIAYDQALELVKNFISELGTKKQARKPRLALIPAGKMFRELVKDRECFSEVELVGGFDTATVEPYSYEGVTVYPTDRLRSFSLDHILLIQNLLAWEIFQQISQILDLTQTALFCPFWDPGVMQNTATEEIEATLQARVAGDIEAINALCTRSPDHPVILFTCIQFYSFLFKRLEALRRAKAKIILVTLTDHVSNAMPVAEMQGAYDYLFSAHGYMLAYLQVLSRIKPDVVHIFANAGVSGIPVLASKVCRAPYYVEYNDILTTMFDRQSLAESIGKEEAEIEMNCEKELVEKSAGFIHKYHPSAVEQLFHVHGIRTNTLQFFPYPVTRPTFKGRPRKPGDPWRIVFIGGILSEKKIRTKKPTKCIE